MLPEGPWDQICYTLSNEYFTQYTFKQFSIPWAYEVPRVGAAFVGVLSTWWMGVIICALLGFFGFMFKTSELMAISIAKSVVVVVTVALIASLLGLINGYYQVNQMTVMSYMRWVPSGVTDPIQFVRVGHMHNTGYIGGLAGLVAGIIYLFILKRRYTQPLCTESP